ncbi:MAG: VOC family protein [Deltaproteobacteria bacterium]|nr:MAG: VOC family protein [Deltaproteobacteria bacterium]
MEIKYLDHFNIKASKGQLSEVRDFYIDVLGFKVGFRPKLSGPGQWLYAGSNAMVHLSEDENRTSRKAEDFLDHIAMRCVGVNEFAKKLDEYSIQFRPAYIPEIDLTQLFFKDPAGVTIELNFKGEKLSE